MVRIAAQMRLLVAVQPVQSPPEPVTIEGNATSSETSSTGVMAAYVRSTRDCDSDTGGRMRKMAIGAAFLEAPLP